jgi:4Fe-4S ferredoxin
MTEDACKKESGILMPIINLSKCEGKEPCVTICPYNVLEMQRITESDYNQLTFKGKLKTFIHGKNKAYLVKPDQCHSCGLCVTACPENAIKLGRFMP